MTDKFLCCHEEVIGAFWCRNRNTVITFTLFSTCVRVGTGCKGRDKLHEQVMKKWISQTLKGCTGPPETSNPQVSKKNSSVDKCKIPEIMFSFCDR